MVKILSLMCVFLVSVNVCAKSPHQLSLLLKARDTADKYFEKGKFAKAKKSEREFEKHLSYFAGRGLEDKVKKLVSARQRAQWYKENGRREDDLQSKAEDLQEEIEDALEDQK